MTIDGDRRFFGGHPSGMVGKKGPPQAKPLPRLDPGRNSAPGGGLGSGFGGLKVGFEAKMASEVRPGVPGSQCSPERALVWHPHTLPLWEPHTPSVGITHSQVCGGRAVRGKSGGMGSYTHPRSLSRAAVEQAVFKTSIRHASRTPTAQCEGP